MTVVAKRLHRVRRGLGARWPSLVMLATWPVIASGEFATPLRTPADLVRVSWIAVFVVTLCWSIVRSVLGSTRASAIREFEQGGLMLTGVYVLLALSGGTKSVLYPLVYALLSFLMVLHERRLVAAAWMGVAVALEGFLLLASGMHHWRVAAMHATFMGFFAAGNLLVLASLASRLRRDHRARMSGEIARMRQEARDFRLIASQLPLESRTRRREDEELCMAQGAVESIHEQVFHQLQLLRIALGLHTCALLWLVDDEQQELGPRRQPRLRIREIDSASEVISEQPDIESPGLLAAMLRDQRPLRLKALNGRRIPYYAGPETVTDLCAVPLVEHANLRGLLVADRVGDRPFEAVEQDTLEKAAQHVLRLIEHERVFAAVERSKYEQEQFYRASEQLNQALTLEQVCLKTFAAVRAIASYQLAVITSYDAVTGEHRVLSVDLPPQPEGGWKDVAAKLEQLVFDDRGLVAMAVKNRHYMPIVGERVDPDTMVFDERTRLRKVQSLLVLPLLHGDKVLGAITLASSQPAQYPPATREMLRVISHQVGVSLQNARIYLAMEERATTDGLTGLTNHRAFQERLTHLHALAERTGQKFAIILTDIDHFKSINDTYGHPVGDQVLKRVAAIFTGRSRKVDIVARYGGEEFVLVLPDTDGVGAEHFANQLREEVANQTMSCEHGTFRVTISMGVSEYPGDVRERDELIERADQALYWCKEHGRNRVARWSTVH